MVNKIAVIEVPSKKYEGAQQLLHTLLKQKGYDTEQFDPTRGCSKPFRPRDFALVVNRLSATAYDSDAAPGPWYVSRNWLFDAECQIGPDRVINGVRALQVDSSKAVQDEILEQFGVNPPTLRYPTLEAIVKVEEQERPYWGNSPVIRKYVAGGSGTATASAESFAGLMKSIEDREPASVTHDNAILNKLRENLEYLHAGTADLVIVQRAIVCDPDEEVYKMRVAAKNIPEGETVRWILRVECMGDKVRHCVKIARIGTNFCAHKDCPEDKYGEIRPADGLDEVPKFIHAISLRIAREAGMKLAGIEWMRDMNDGWWVIDVNSLSIYREQYAKFPNVKPWELLAEYLVELANEVGR